MVATDWFKTVLSGDTIFEGRDTDFDCVLNLAEIDVSGHSELEVSAAFSEVGALENSDFIRFQYILDGQTTWSQPRERLHDRQPEPGADSDGSTLQLQVVMRTNANNERIPSMTSTFGVPNCQDNDGDGICNDVDACSDLTACNFSDPAATSCLYNDACGV